MASHNTTVVKFVGQDLEIPISYAKDVSFILFLGMLDYIEMRDSQGIIVFRQMLRNLGLEMDDELQQRIETILIKNTNLKKDKDGHRSQG